MSGKNLLVLSISALLSTCVLGSAGCAAAQEAPATPGSLEYDTMALAAAEGSKDEGVLPTTIAPKNSLELYVANHYFLGDLGKEVAHGAVLQGSYLRKVGSCLVGTWVSLGRDQFGKELDLISFCDGKSGPVSWEVSAQDFFLNGRGGPLVMGNNVAQFYAEGNIPLKATSWLTIAPAVRVTQQVGFGAYPDHTILQAGARVTVNLTARDSLTGAVLPTLVDPGKQSGQFGLTRVDMRYTHALAHGVSLFAGLHDHTGRPQEFYMGLGYSW